MSEGLTGQKWNLHKILWFRNSRNSMQLNRTLNPVDIQSKSIVQNSFSNINI